MDEIKTKVDKISGKKIFYSKSYCGLNMGLIPIKRNRSYAFFSVPLGGKMKDFKDRRGNTVQIPGGIAHFLEHQMFDKKDGHVLAKFDKMGSYNNAFTSYSHTTYMVGFTSKLKENLTLLSDLALSLEITDKSVEKERGIILEEMKRSQDSPDRLLYNETMRALYSTPYAVPILGYEDDVNKAITKELLEACHDNFYHPSLTDIVIVGNHRPKSTFSFIESLMESRGVEYRDTVELIRYDEPREVANRRVELSREIPIPKVAIAFKRYIPKDESPEKNFKETVAMETLVETLFGGSSEIYYDLYSRGVIDSSFSAGYYDGGGFGFSILGGDMKNPLEFEKEIIKGIEKVRSTGVPETEFQRNLKKIMGNFIRVFDDADSAGSTYIHHKYSGGDLFDYLRIANDLKMSEVNDLLKGHFDLDNYSFVVIKPKKDACVYQNF